MLWSCVRGGPGDPGQWPDWSNDAWWHHLDTGVTGKLDLGPGLVFRLAVTARHIAYTRVHPDGDELILLNAPPTDGSRPVVGARLPLPAMSGAPRRGGTPGTACSGGPSPPPPAGAWWRSAGEATARSTSSTRTGRTCSRP